MSTIETGKAYECEYPFVKCKVPDYKKIQSASECNCSWYDCGCNIPVVDEVESWKPGTEHQVEEYSEIYTADGLGKRILTVVSIHKPGKYPERVFYTQKWKDPDGKVFGKNNLRVTTTGNFKLMLKGHRHGFELGEEIYHGSVFRYTSG